MKKKSLSAIIILSLLALMISGCENQSEKIKYMESGYADFQNCLKQCDDMEARYTAEYNNCKVGCPAPEPNFEFCEQVSPANYRACMLEEVKKYAAFVACQQCAEDYIIHMNEVNECRRLCLNEYNRRFLKMVDE